jgi:sulfatase modifying factor 1
VKIARLALAVSLSLCLAPGCRDGEHREPAAESREIADAAPPWSPRSRTPTPPYGMIWVPPGALIAGTPPDRLPRVADEEMPGEQIVLGGFFMDAFAYPNEEGAIPQTGATWEQARERCAERGKRLCTELEWERACKGPRNLVYEYGDRYRAEACSTGKSARMLPSGHRPACRSEFGARDMHGGVWEWTASRWGRGLSAELMSLRGGNDAAGELVGRCANALARPPSTSASNIGFRCCKGELNEAVVDFPIERGPALEQRGKVERELAVLLDSVMPPDIKKTLLGYGSWRIQIAWDWRPIGNVKLVVGGACAGAAPSRRCGVIVADLSPGSARLMAWVWAGLYLPAARTSQDARRLWIYGGDRMSHFRQAVLYEWGTVRLGDLERNVRPGAD